MPLIDGVIRDAVEADLAIRPGLHAGPFDALIKIPRLPRRKMIDMAGRSSGAPRVDAHADIAVGYPFFGVDHLPVLILVGRSVSHVRVACNHGLPGARIALLEGEPLG